MNYKAHLVIGCNFQNKYTDLEGPQEVGSEFELVSDGEDLVNQVFNTDNVHLAQLILNDRVGGNGNPLSVHFSEASLVHEFLDGLQVGVAPCDVRFADTEHVQGGLVQLDEDTIVDLLQTEQLENLAYLW